jgi:hypothetical protein
MVHNSKEKGYMFRCKIRSRGQAMKDFFISVGLYQDDAYCWHCFVQETFHRLDNAIVQSDDKRETKQDVGDGGPDQQSWYCPFRPSAFLRLYNKNKE